MLQNKLNVFYFLPKSKWGKFSFACFLLFLLNVMLFYKHYFHDGGFPWDFNLTYFAVPYYWITSMQHGLFAQWVAQQAMGYPLFMNLQSGFFYPFFWFFVIVNKTFTIHTAVIFQCLHIVLGSIGVLYFCRIQNVPFRYAIIAAIGYQMFGGFYSNAEHADVIRGYALIPWLLSGLIIGKDNKNQLRPVVLIPISIFLLSTAGYTGQFVAAIWFGIILCLVQFFVEQELSWRDKLRMLLLRYGAMALGLVICCVQELPVWLLRDELIRSSSFSSQLHSFFTYRNFFTYYFSGELSANLVSDISMRSTFITLPLFGLLFFLRVSKLRVNLSFIIMYLVAWGMISDNMISSVLRQYVSFLGLSRFPTVDYRAYLAIIPLYFSVVALQDIVEKRTIKLYLFRIVLFLIVVFYGISSLQPEIIGKVSLSEALITPLVLLLSVLLLEISIIIFFVFLFAAKYRNYSTYWLLGFFIIFVYVDALRIWIKELPLWYYEHATMALSNDIKGYVAKDLIASIKGGTRRPARLPITVGPVYRGYFTGEFMLSDYSAGTQLLAYSKVIAQPKLVKFMQLPSGFTIVNYYKGVGSEPHVSLLDHQLITKANANIVLDSYTNDRLVYRVKLDAPRIILENEMYFPGWSGTLMWDKSKVSHILPFKILEGLRAWKLPAGNYLFIETFFMPWLRIAGYLTLLAILLWGILVGYFIFDNYKRSTTCVK